MDFVQFVEIFLLVWPVFSIFGTSLSNRKEKENNMFDAINKFLDGKKTLLAGIAGFGVFLTSITTQLSDGFQASDIQPILVAFMVFMAIFGIGGKLQKLIDATKILK